MKTTVEWLEDTLYPYLNKEDKEYTDVLFNKAKEMEKNDTDNKVIHFAEWLTKKHTSTLITLYEHFEEQYYNETFKSE
jgi:hypothetical protein